MKPLEPVDPSTEPLRLRDGGGGEVERLLVGSARLDGAPSAARARVAAALGVPVNGAAGAAGVASGGAGAATGLLRAGWGRVASVGAASIVSAVMAWRVLAPAPVADAPIVAAPASAPAEPTTGRHSEEKGGRVPSPTPVEASPRSLAAAPVTAPAAARPSVQRRPLRASRAPAPSADGALPARGHGLLEEVALLDRVRSSLETRGPAAAADVLSEYERRFPRGELALEAELLRVDVAARSGRRDEAADRARALLAKPGGARYRARLEPLLSGAAAR